MKSSIKSYIKSYMKFFNSLQKLIYFMGIDGFRGSGQWKTQKPFENVAFSHFWAMKLIKKLQKRCVSLTFWLLYGPREFRKTEVPRPYARRLDPAGVQKGTIFNLFYGRKPCKTKRFLAFWWKNGVRNAIAMKLIREFCMKPFNSLRQNGHPWN